MRDQQVGQFAPTAGYKECHEIPFYFDWIGVPREPHALGQPRDMRVNHDALLHAKRVPQHNIRRLSSHATQCQERIHAAWHFAAEVLLQ